MNDDKDEIYFFDHEKLNVYRKALIFVEWAGEIVEQISPKISACKHIDESSSSILLNIAEGNGKYTSKDRCHYFDIARGSALECAAALDILMARKKLNKKDNIYGKNILHEIVAMLIGLIKSNSNRAYETNKEYKSSIDS